MHVPPVHAWLPLLQDVTLRGSLLVLLVLLTCYALRNRSATLRHRIWSLLLLALLGLPFLTRLLSWSGTTVIIPLPLTHAVTAGAPASQDGSTLSLLLITLWLTGAALITLRLGIGLCRVWWLTRRAQPLDHGWTSLLQEAKAALDVTRDVTLRMSTRRISPLTWGIWPAVVLLPADAHAWHDQTKRAVLLHELAHIKRHDWLWQLLGQLTCAVYWFNPLVWLAARSLRNEGEAATDQHALQSDLKPSVYAQALLELAASRRSHLRLPLVMTMVRSPLERRLRRILQPQEATPALARPVVMTLLGTAGAVTLLLTAVQLEPQRSVQAEQAAPGLQAAQQAAPYPELALVLMGAGTSREVYQPHMIMVWTQGPPQVVRQPVTRVAAWIVYDPSANTFSLMMHPRPDLGRRHPRYRM